MATDLQHREESEQFRVLDAPNLPNSPSFPNRLYFVLGGMGGGLVLGVVLAILQEAKDRTLRTEKDVEFFLHLPALALIPSVASMRNGGLQSSRVPGSPSLVTGA
jgi:capsular polysaccharide biosynthesis protein